MQDGLGYMWFATDNGVVKYNGSEFTVFDINDGLPSSDVYKIFIDSKNRVWVHSLSNEFGYIENDKYQRLDLDLGDDVKRIGSIFELNGWVYFDAGVWQSSEVYRMKDDTLELCENGSNWGYIFECRGVIGGVSNMDSMCTVVFTKDFKTYDTVCYKKKIKYEVHKYANQTTGDLLVFYKDTYPSFAVFNLADCQSKIINVSDLKGEETDETIKIVFAYKDHIDVITNQAVYTLSSSLEVENVLDVSTTFPVPVHLVHYSVDNNNNTWFASKADGVWLDPKTELTRNDNLNNELDKCSFLTSLDNGVSVWWNPYTMKAIGIDSDLKTAFSVKLYSQVRSAVSYKGNVLFYTLNSGFWIYDLSKKTLARFDDEVTKEDDDADKKRPVEHGLPEFNELYPFSFVFNRTGDLYAFDPTYLVKLNINGPGTSFRSLYFDRLNGIFFDKQQDMLWFYNRQKLGVYSERTDKMFVVKKNKLREAGIRIIHNVFADRYSNVYIHSDSGLLVINTRSNNSSYVPLSVNINDIHTTVIDDYLVVCGRFGLGYYKITGPLSLSSFRVIPNTQNRNYKKVLALNADSTGNIFVNTDKGVFTTSITEFTEGRSYPAERISSLVLNEPKERKIHFTDTIYTDRESKYLRFDYINFLGAGNRVYNYYIAGQNDWQNNVAGEIFIGDIPAGAYKKLQVYVTDEMWRTNTYNIYLYRSPHWYETTAWLTVFWISGFAVLIGLILLAIVTTRHIVARNNEKRRQMTDLELRALYAQINPHFIFNSLGTSLYFIDNKKFDEAYAHVNKFSRLLRSYLKSSQQRYIVLEEEIEMLRNYIELQKSRFEEKFDFSIDVENKIPVKSIMIPSLLLQPLVENAINHGLFHMRGKKGMLALRFKQGKDSDELICEIEDNGVGREKAAEIKRNSSDRTESYGTKLTTQLIQIFKEYEKMNIKLEYFDKLDGETGTLVRLTIKNLKYVV